MENRWIWPFELLDKLGEGGMGVVYRARYVGNNRLVAVKLVPEDVAANPTLLARFERELDVLKLLRHPHIVHCFGGTCESKQHFYAMEIVDGGTLHNLIQDVGKLPWETAVDYGLQMCAALEYAHEKNVIHRDVKPGNFLMTKEGKLKLSDFGLAVVVASQRITAAGKTMGTFHYMAPEQIRGKPPVTNRTDLYALGCVLYEMLTGNPPFDADHAAEVLHQHLKEAPPRAAQSVADCPRDLDQLINDLLEKDPEVRPASATVVAQRLKAIENGPSMALSFSPTPAALQILSEVESGLESAPEPVHSLIRWPFWAAMTLLILAVCWNLALQGSQRRLQQRVSKAEEMSIEMFQKGDEPLKIAIIETLGNMETLSPQTEKFLFAEMAKENRTIRLAIIKGLHGNRAREARPYLVKMTRQVELDAEVSKAVNAALEEAKKPLVKPLERSTFLSWLLPLFSCLILGAFAWYLWLWWTGHPAVSSA